jgi:hypothetical protein
MRADVSKKISDMAGSNVLHQATREEMKAPYKRMRGSGVHANNYKVKELYSAPTKACDVPKQGTDSQRMSGILTCGDNVIGEINPKRINE